MYSIQRTGVYIVNFIIACTFEHDPREAPIKAVVIFGKHIVFTVPEN